MARRLQDKTNVTAPGGNYPYGRVKNNSGANDGTPVDENLVGDEMQFWERLLAIGGVIANGLPENSANTFQYMIALINIIVAQATTLVNAEAAIRAAADTNLSNTKVAKSGDTMTGNLQMSGFTVGSLATPAATGDAAPKGYVDSQDSAEATARANADEVDNTAWRTDVTWAASWATGSLPLKFKIFHGLLIVKGGANKTGAVADGDLMFTLPSGCRVDSVRVVSVMSNGVVGTDQVATFSVILATNGDVTVKILKNAGVSAINTPIFLDNICLPIA
jgi:hypothetical protein